MKLGMAVILAILCTSAVMAAEDCRKTGELLPGERCCETSTESTWHLNEPNAPKIHICHDNTYGYIAGKLHLFAIAILFFMFCWGFRMNRHVISAFEQSFEEKFKRKITSYYADPDLPVKVILFKGMKFRSAIENSKKLGLDQEPRMRTAIMEYKVFNLTAFSLIALYIIGWAILALLQYSISN